MSFERKLIILFSIILLSVFTIGIVIFSQRKTIHYTDYWVQHTHQELYVAQIILSGVQDIETSSEEYIITGDSNSLQPFVRSIEILNEQISNLEKLNYQHPSQKTRISLLRKLVNERINFSLETNKLRKQRKFTQTEQLEAFGKSNRLLTNIGKTIAAIQQEENNLLLRRQAALEKSFEAARSPFVFLGIVAILIIIIFLIIRHNNRVRQRAEEKLQQINDELTQSITLQKQQQEELINQAQKLEQLNNELKAFSYTVSHDLKNPLSVIKYTSDKIYKNYRASFSENDQKLFHAMVNQTAFMNDLITDLLQYAIADYNTEEKKDIDLNELVKEIIKKYESQSSIKILIKNTLPNIIFGRTHIMQVFENLISNAVKYMDKPSGVIEIGSEDAGNSWKFYVKDNGPGIEEKYLSKIFQPFQKAHTRSDVQGTGIGLSIIKKIIENAGGKVWIETETGIGSAFYFTIRKDTNQQEK